nr:MAG TPA: hypothetical protein [Bacteriophage sp.]DAH14219.1 MAG TPA: hypothetical protein [Caudoviricetes sp.]DAH37732.1 MAG TPA: hypothetical protein [Caudoviricetes sp.]
MERYPRIKNSKVGRKLIRDISSQDHLTSTFIQNDLN